MNGVTVAVLASQLMLRSRIEASAAEAR